MKKMKYIRLLIIMVAILFGCSVCNISANENTDDEVQEKIDETKNISEEFGEEQENLESFSNIVGINWTVKSGIRKRAKEFYKKKGSTVNINLKLSPETQSVKVGYIDKDEVKHYKTVKGKINHSFTIQKTGYIQVFVENNSGKTVTVTGNYIK